MSSPSPTGGRSGWHTEQAWERYERYCSPETTRCGPVLTLADCGGFLLREYLRTGSTRPVSAAVSALSVRFNAMLSHPFVALHVAGVQASACDLRLSLRLVEAVSQFASGHFADAADTLKSVPVDLRIAVGGSRVERMLVDLLEARAVALAA